VQVLIDLLCCARWQELQVILLVSWNMLYMLLLYKLNRYKMVIGTA